jgi:prepilin-type N-terminal cleavage/methylation domain-containing protein
MLPPPDAARRGMTLVELLVVVVILGLLGVATLPTINTSGPKRRLRDAATAVESHFNQTISKAVGARTGSGAWMQATGTAGTAPTTTLSFCGGGTEAAGTATLKLTSPTAAHCEVSLSPSFATLTGSTSYLHGTPPNGCLIRFAGFPYEYTFADANTLSLPGSATTSGMMWPAASNGTYSGTTSPLPVILSIPPGKTTGGKTVLGGNTCVDLTWSTIGVLGYSQAYDIPSNAAPLIITYDSLGRAKSVIYQKAGGSVQQRRLDPRTPIAILVGLQDQVGQPQIAIPTDENPGTNWQRSDAWWVVIDPRTSTTFRVENAPNSATLEAAQRFIRQTLLNDNTAP